MAEKLKEICLKNKIWFSLDKETLLGAVRHGGFLPWYEKFNIMITLDGYHRLKRLFPTKIIESSVDKKYSSLTISFVEDNRNWQADQPFIEMRVAIPTTIEKIKSFRSFRRFMHNLISFRNENNIKQCINELRENRFSGYYLLDGRDSSVRTNWIQVMTFKVDQINFNGVDFPIFKEYDEFLKQLFGDNYMKKHIVPGKWFRYDGPSRKSKEF